MYRRFSVNQIVRSTLYEHFSTHFNVLFQRARLACTYTRVHKHIKPRSLYGVGEKRVQRENVIVYLGGTRPCKYSSKKSNGPAPRVLCACVCVWGGVYGLSLKRVYCTQTYGITRGTKEKFPQRFSKRDTIVYTTVVPLKEKRKKRFPSYRSHPGAHECVHVFKYIIACHRRRGWKRKRYATANKTHFRAVLFDGRACYMCVRRTCFCITVVFGHSYDIYIYTRKRFRYPTCHINPRTTNGIRRAVQTVHFRRSS